MNQYFITSNVMSDKSPRFWSFAYDARLAKFVENDLF